MFTVVLPEPWSEDEIWINLSLCFDQTWRNHKLDTNQINVAAGTASFGQTNQKKVTLMTERVPPQKKNCMTMENPPFEGVFSHWKWWFSNVMLVFRGVNQFPLKFWLKQVLLKAIGRLQSNWWHIRVATTMSRWWFQIFSMGKIPILTNIIFQLGVSTTNQDVFWLSLCLGHWWIVWWSIAAQMHEADEHWPKHWVILFWYTVNPGLTFQFRTYMLNVYLASLWL